MRIIAGSLKGRRLAPVKGRTRPTAAKVREAVFNILGNAVAGAQVLDLFAGTGALGIEALSRGAERAVLVEDHPEALRALRRNLENLQLGDCTLVLPLSVAAAVKKLAARGEKFNLIFLDPPYTAGVAEKTLAALAGGGLVRPRAWVVAEHSRRQDLPITVGLLQRRDVRRYGDTQVAFYLAGDDSAD